MPSKTHSILGTSFSLISGVLFGIGLILAGMANPQKVLGFLDIAGSWDPSLGFVMAGALVVSGVGFCVAKQRKKTVFNEHIELSNVSSIDKRLVLGSLAFGCGWGFSGICPGAVLVLIGMGSNKGFIFFIALIAGFTIYELITKAKKNT